MAEPVLQRGEGRFNTETSFYVEKHPFQNEQEFLELNLKENVNTTTEDEECRMSPKGVGEEVRPVLVDK